MPTGVPMQFSSYSETSENKKTTENEKSRMKTELNNSDKLVIHRKSERRRVARDIFLVFEEQSSRRYGRNGKPRRNHTKSKFSHLTVENSKKRARGLLRDIKNEPNCYLNPIAVANASRTVFKKRNGVGCSSRVQKEQNSLASEASASVNPIFLWAKQDDTRIIEVRCEDYDKRNRIRLTKTTTGWRAIPRSDASTSRIAKLFQTPSSLIKLKRDLYDTTLLVHSSMSDKILSPDSLKSIIISKQLKQKYDNVSTTKNKLHNFKKIKKDHNKFISFDKCNYEITCHGNKVGQKDIDNLNKKKSKIENLFTEKDKGYQSNIFCSETYQYYGSNTDLCSHTGLCLSTSCQKAHKDEIRYNDNGAHDRNSQNQLNDCFMKDFHVNPESLKDIIEKSDLIQGCVGGNSQNNKLGNSLVDCVFENNETSDKDKNSKSFAPSKKLINTEMVLTEIIKPSNQIVKCLSYNENQEMLELNDAVFPTKQNLENTFNKKKFLENGILPPEKQTKSFLIPSTTSPYEKGNNSPDISQKDLSFKTLESIPLGPNKQCEVTSTSNVLQSSYQNKKHITPAKTIRNLLFEKIMDFNALNTLPKNTLPNQDAEEIAIANQIPESESVLRFQPATSHKFVKSLLIGDKISNEPVKKKLCNRIDKQLTVTIPITSCMPSNVNGDPDPLTQLQLLIGNTQWKVPDPILVPKDRLDAVLASPAREIPLLITTRPDLKLPEAFAYPHIIQNPNILVISMAQLETILRKNIETVSTQLQKDVDHKFQIKTLNSASNSVSPSMNTKCSFDVNDSITTNINTATLAVIDQMLWLPYINQCSKEVFKNLRNSVSLQNQKSNILSPYNIIPIGLHVNNLYKNYVNQMSSLKLHQSSTEVNSEPHSIYMGTMGALRNEIDVMVVQNLIHQGLSNFENTIQLSSLLSPNDQDILHFPNNTSNSDSVKHIKTFNQQNSTNNCLKLNSMEPHSNNYINKSVSSQNLTLDNNAKLSTFTPINQKEISKNLPKLTCKSISNLLEPENRDLTTMCVKTFESQASLNFYNYHVDGNIQPTNSYDSSETCQQRNSNSVVIEEQCQRSWPNFIQPHVTPKKTFDLLRTEDNSTISNSLFSRNEYNSQWKWTTVTAAGE